MASSNIPRKRPAQVFVEQYMDDSGVYHMGVRASSIQFDVPVTFAGNDTNITREYTHSGLVVGKVVYLSAADTVAAADANDVAKMPAVGIVSEVVSATSVRVTEYGVYTTTGLTAGATYYVSETAGAYTSTKPTTDGVYIQEIGVAISTTQLLVTVNAAEKLSSEPNVHHVGTGMEYAATAAGLAAAITASANGERVLIHDSISSITSTIAVNKSIVLEGAVPGITLSSAANIATVTCSTTDGWRLKNLGLTNTGVAGTEFALHTNATAGTLENVTLTCASGINAWNNDMAAGKIIRAHNLIIASGGIDHDGNATSELHMYGGEIAGACNFAIGIVKNYATIYSGAVTYTSTDMNVSNFNAVYESTVAYSASTGSVLDMGTSYVGVMTSTFQQTMRMKSVEFTAAPVFNHATLNIYAEGLSAVSHFTVTDCGSAYINGLFVGGNLVLTDFGTFHAGNVEVVGTINSATPTGTVLIDGLIAGNTLTIADSAGAGAAGQTARIINANIAGLLTVTAVATATFDYCNFNGTGTNNIVDVDTIITFNYCNSIDAIDLVGTANDVTRAVFNNCIVAQIAMTAITAVSLVEINHSRVTGAWADSANVAQIDAVGTTFVGNVAFDGVVWNSDNCHFFGTVTETVGAGTFTDRGSIIEGLLTNTGGTFVVDNTRLLGGFTGTVTGSYLQAFPTDYKTVGTDGIFATVANAITGIVAADTYILPDQLYALSAQAAVSQPTTWRGVGDDVTITNATAAESVLVVTGDGTVLENLILDHTGNLADGVALTVTNVALTARNCNFDGGTNAAGSALVITADGADYCNFYNCNFVDGVITITGNAASRVRFYNCTFVDAVTLATAGLAEFYNCIGGTLTPGAGTIAKVYGGSWTAIDPAPTGILYLYNQPEVTTLDGAVFNNNFYASANKSQVNHFYDDFDLDALDARWTVSNAGAGGEVDFAVVTAVGGEVAGTTGNVGADRWVLLDSGAFYNYHAGLHCGMEFRIKVNLVTLLDATFGFYKDADEYAYMYVDVSGKADASIFCAASLNGGVGATDTDSTVDLAANTYITGKIQCFDDGSVKYYINGALVRTDPASTIATAAQLMKPYFRCSNEGAGGAGDERTMTIDYVEIWQDRA